MPNTSEDIKSAASEYFANNSIGPDDQTRIGAFCINAKCINAMILSQNEIVPASSILYRYLHKQYYKELELSTLLRKSIQWSLNPMIYAEVARRNMAFGVKNNIQRFYMGCFQQQRIFFEYLALSHAFMSEIRFIPLFPADASLDAPFMAALYDIDVENGRQIQTQIRLLKELEISLSLNEKEAVIHEKRSVVAGLFEELLRAICG